MALIDALMAGQQFVAGMQQQQQAAREYRDRMAMLAREEERAMREEGRGIARDIRAAQFQDFQRGLMESEEERKQKEFESTMDDIEWTKLNREELLQQKRDMHEANLKAIDQQYRLGELKYDEYIEAKNLEKKADPLRSRVIDFQRRAAQDPSSITPEMLNSLQGDILNFMESNPRASQSVFPMYNTLMQTAQFARDNGATLLQPSPQADIIARREKAALEKEVTSPGREAGRIGSGTRFFFSGPDLRGGLLTREFGGREMVPSESYLRSTQAIEAKKDPVGGLLGSGSILNRFFSPAPDPAVLQFLDEQ